MKAALAVAISAAAVVTGSAQQPTFSSRVDAVRVDVLVKDRGQIVRGLGPRDFEVRDEGVLQEVDLVRLEQIPLNVILGFDVSESVNGERLEHLLSAGNTLLASAQSVTIARATDVQPCRAAASGVDARHHTGATGAR